MRRGAVGAAAALYRGPRLGEVLLQLADESSLVIVDGPPLSTEGAPALARQAEATLVVVNALSADPELIAQTAETAGAAARTGDRRRR